ncbi:MAG TPA: LuxR C-terminal-related transcriptional regulator [Mycobacteriales bacterium]|nr:LuxR C-terminal-related transcriptional regulator [Mycobacteriales bacterium]
MNALRALGLGEEDERLYRAILEAPGTDCARLAATLGVSSAHAELTLENLIRLGLATVLGGTKTVHPATPKSALHLLELRKRQELLEREEALDAARQEAERLVESFEHGKPREPVEMVETIHGQEEVAQRFESLQRESKHEIMMFDRPPYATTSDDTQHEMQARGVIYRGLYDPSALECPDQPDKLLRCVAAGEQARISTGIPLKMVIADRRVALVPLNIDQPALLSSLVVHTSSILDALILLFENLWERASPFGLAPSEEPDLTAFDQQMLVLMAAGFNDQRVARQLGVSQRTLARRITSLTARLGAESRFQAGVAAAGKGWV